MGLFPDLEVASRVRNYLNQEYGDQVFFEIKKASEKISYKRIYAGGFTKKSKAETLKKLLAKKEKKFESSFVTQIKK